MLENFEICMSMIEMLAEDQDEITFNWDISGFFSMMSSTIMNRYFIKNLKLPTILAVPKSQIKNLKQQIKRFFLKMDHFWPLFLYFLPKFLISVTDWAIYFTLGSFSKPFATINLPKSPTFLDNFCKGVKIFNFSREIIFGQLFLVTMDFCSILWWKGLRVSAKRD